jgi:hypothetical protein
VAVSSSSSCYYASGNRVFHTNFEVDDSSDSVVARTMGMRKVSNSVCIDGPHRHAGEIQVRTVGRFGNDHTPSNTLFVIFAQSIVLHSNILGTVDALGTAHMWRTPDMCAGVGAAAVVATWDSAAGRTTLTPEAGLGREISWAGLCFDAADASGGTVATAHMASRTVSLFQDGRCARTFRTVLPPTQVRKEVLIHRQSFDG